MNMMDRAKRVFQRTLFNDKENSEMAKTFN